MISFSVDRGILHVNGQPVSLPLSVAECVDIGEVVAVRLDVPAGQVFNRNVFLVGGDGEIRWQIHESPHGTAADSPFMSLWVEEGTLAVGNWNGVDYDVDLVSGNIRARAFNK